MTLQEIIQIDNKGRIVLPQKVRHQANKYYTLQAEEDGTVHLIPVVGLLTSKQAYFWTKRWQKGEREASESIKQKKYKTIPPDKLDQYLKSL